MFSTFLLAARTCKPPSRLLRLGLSFRFGCRFFRKGINPLLWSARAKTLAFMLRDWLSTNTAFLFVLTPFASGMVGHWSVAKVTSPIATTTSATTTLRPFGRSVFVISVATLATATLAIPAITAPGTIVVAVGPTTATTALSFRRRRTGGISLAGISVVSGPSCFSTHMVLIAMVAVPTSQTDVTCAGIVGYAGIIFAVLLALSHRASRLTMTFALAECALL